LSIGNGIKGITLTDIATSDGLDLAKGLITYTGEQAQKKMRGEISKKVKKGKSKNANLFAVIEATVELVGELRKNSKLD
jgi:hypothetical protein